MRIGAVSLWLLLLLSERLLYGYELRRELERRFSGYWKPKTGTIYPALEKLEQNGLVTSRIEFRDEGPDRKHYALTEKGQAELSKSMSYWTKMIEVLETYREVHEALLRYKAEMSKEDLSNLLMAFAQSLKKGNIEMRSLVPSGRPVTISPSEPLNFKLLYAKENGKLEIHIELEWVPMDQPQPSRDKST
jgi:PadR family transcriptional regulator PadR